MNRVNSAWDFREEDSIARMEGSEGEADHGLWPVLPNGLHCSTARVEATHGRVFPKQRQNTNTQGIGGAPVTVSEGDHEVDVTNSDEESIVLKLKPESVDSFQESSASLSRVSRCSSNNQKFLSPVKQSPSFRIGLGTPCTDMSSSLSSIVSVVSTPNTKFSAIEKRLLRATNSRQQPSPASISDTGLEPAQAARLPENPPLTDARSPNAKSSALVEDNPADSDDDEDPEYVYGKTDSSNCSSAVSKTTCQAQREPVSAVNAEPCPTSPRRILLQHRNALRAFVTGVPAGDNGGLHSENKGNRAESSVIAIGEVASHNQKSHRLLRQSRIAVVVILVVGACTIATSTYNLNSHRQGRRLRSQMSEISQELLDNLLRATSSKFWDARALSVLVTSSLKSDPNCTNYNLSIPSFEEVSYTHRKASGAYAVSYSPLLRDQLEREEFESYVVRGVSSQASQNSDWLLANGVYRVDGEGQPQYDNTAPPYHPILLQSTIDTPSTMYNQYSEKARARALDQMMGSGLPVMTDITKDKPLELKAPAFAVYYPVFGSNRSVVGSVVSEYLWADFIRRYVQRLQILRLGGSPTLETYFCSSLTTIRCF
jgi:CHASE domain